ncbi:MAG: hypothetical protein R2824_19010 [Saprospiraceae bacterium]|nr:hypothetical protein [Lewinella sp.]
MRPSLRDIELLEAYIHRQLPSDAVDTVRLRLLQEPLLADQLEQQKRTYQLIRQSGRRQLKRELEQLHAELFSERGNRLWQRRILRIFNSSML